MFSVQIALRKENCPHKIEPRQKLWYTEGKISCRKWKEKQNAGLDL